MQTAAILLILRTFREFLVEQRLRTTWRVRTVLFFGAANVLRILNNDDGNNLFTDIIIEQPNGHVQRQQ